MHRNDIIICDYQVGWTKITQKWEFRCRVADIIFAYTESKQIDNTIEMVYILYHLFNKTLRILIKIWETIKDFDKNLRNNIHLMYCNRYSNIAINISSQSQLLLMAIHTSIIYTLYLTDKTSPQQTMTLTYVLHIRS